MHKPKSDPSGQRFFCRRPGRTGAFAALVCGFVLAASPVVARAEGRPFLESGDVLMRGYAIEVAAVAEMGATEYSPTLDGSSLEPQIQGLILRDRHGMTGRVVAGLFVAMATALAASGPKSVESRTYDSGNYRVTETKTTYYSEAEKAEIRARGASSIDGLFGLGGAEFELEIYGRNRFGLGDASGYKVSFLYGGRISESFNLTVGFAWGSVDSHLKKDGMEYHLDHKYVGIPTRLSLATPIGMAQLTFQWNFKTKGVDDEDRLPVTAEDGITRMVVAKNALHFDITGAIFGQLVGSIGVTWAKLSDMKDVGTRVTAGFRF